VTIESRDNSIVSLLLQFKA